MMFSRSFRLSFLKEFLDLLWPKLEERNKHVLFVKLNSNKDADIFLFHDYILDKSCFLFLGFDLNLVLQHGHEISSVSKNNAHKEHHF